MKLLTEELKKQLPALYSQEKVSNPKVVCKFFDPAGSWTWFVIEGSPVDANGFFDTNEPKVDFLFYGLVIGHEKELGYFYLKELENAKKGLSGMASLPIERDRHFKTCTLVDIYREYEIPF